MVGDRLINDRVQVDRAGGAGLRPAQVEAAVFAWGVAELLNYVQLAMGGIEASRACLHAERFTDPTPLGSAKPERGVIAMRDDVELGQDVTLDRHPLRGARETAQNLRELDTVTRVTRDDLVNHCRCHHGIQKLEVKTQRPLRRVVSRSAGYPLECRRERDRAYKAGSERWLKVQTKV